MKYLGWYSKVCFKKKCNLRTIYLLKVKDFPVDFRTGIHDMDITNEGCFVLQPPTI